MNAKPLAAVCLLFSFVASPALGAFLVEVDTDGLDNASITFPANFSFGGGTTTASTSSQSFAFGMTGGDSIFGGNGTPDTYIVAYTPSAEADNLAVPAGTDLGGGNLASGQTGGGAGRYNVYATWPTTTGVSGGPTNYSIQTSGDSALASIDQNNKGNDWVFVGSIDYTSGAITVTQTPTTDGFVSMRLAGILFERVPEPSSVGLVGLALVAIAGGRVSRR